VQYWRVPPLWEGQTAFIVAGGPSVLDQDLDLLRDRNVIAINESWERVPWAEFLFFADLKWWVKHQVAALGFAGRIVTTFDAVDHPRVLHCRRVAPPNEQVLPVCADPCELPVRRTSLTAAIVLAKHLGARRQVLLGVDGKPAPDGTAHHYRRSRPVLLETFVRQARDIFPFAARLAAAGVEIVNASPGSAFGAIWPVTPLEAAIAA